MQQQIVNIKQCNAWGRHLLDGLHFGCFMITNHALGSTDLEERKVRLFGHVRGNRCLSTAWRTCKQTMRRGTILSHNSSHRHFSHNMYVSTTMSETPPLLLTSEGVKGLANHGLVFFVSYGKSFPIVFCVSGVCGVLFHCFWLSVPVQLIAWIDLSLKWPIVCWVGW